MTYSLRSNVGWSAVDNIISISHLKPGVSKVGPLKLTVLKSRVGGRHRRIVGMDGDKVKYQIHKPALYKIAQWFDGVTITADNEMMGLLESESMQLLHNEDLRKALLAYLRVENKLCELYPDEQAASSDDRAFHMIRQRDGLKDDYEYWRRLIAADVTELEVTPSRMTIV